MADEPAKPRRLTVYAEAAAVLTPNGVLFGASVLGREGTHTWMARRVLTAFNARGAFDNLDDNVEGLREILGASFDQVEIESIGSVAVFTAAQPRPA